MGSHKRHISIYPGYGSQLHNKVCVSQKGFGKKAAFSLFNSFPRLCFRLFYLLNHSFFFGGFMFLSHSLFFFPLRMLLRIVSFCFLFLFVFFSHSLLFLFGQQYTWILFFLQHAAYFCSTCMTSCGHLKKFEGQSFRTVFLLPFSHVLMISILPLKYQSQMTNPLIFSNARMT